MGRWALTMVTKGVTRKAMIKSVCCFVALYTLALGSCAFASTVWTSSFVSLGTATIGNPGSCAGGCDSVSSGTGAPVQVADTFVFGGSTLTASSGGQATYGVLHAASAASFRVTGQALASEAETLDITQELMTISFAPWNGSPGLLHLSYTIDGTIQSTGGGGAWTQVDFLGMSGGNLVSYGYQTFTSSISGSFNLPGAIPFIYGTPFLLQIELITAAGSMSPDLDFSLATGAGYASANFSNTLVLSGLIPTDLNGVEAADPTFTSGSGTHYSVNGVVPEPSTGVLILMSAVILAIGRRRLLGIAVAPSLRSRLHE